jgi:DNA-binding cell septation regulator SpoVG
MDIRTIWRDGQYPSFNLELASSDMAEAFLVVKGCKVMSGSKGQFVAGPSTKGKDDKYWNHTFMSEKFNAVVLEKALESMPQPKAQIPQNKQHRSDDDSIPF